MLLIFMKKMFTALGIDDVLSETAMDGILYLEDEFDKVCYFTA